MQDTIIVTLSVVAAMLIFRSASFLLGVTGSAIVIGLALQDTLGNAFAGLAIQVERPFRVGNWIQAAGHEGRVTEVTWRATKSSSRSPRCCNAWFALSTSSRDTAARNSS